MRRRPITSGLLGFSLGAAVLLALGSGSSSAPLPGGWEQVGSNTATPTQPALNGIVLALNTDRPGVMYVGGNFTDAGGDPNADYIAQWDGTTWKSLGAPKLNAQVAAIAYRNGKVYAGGNFTAAGGNSAAGFLAVWDGTRWGPVCKPSGPGGNVHSLEISGSTLYIGGSFQRGAGISNANYMLACDLNTGAARALVDGYTSSSVAGLGFDSRGALYAGGGFGDLDGIPAADMVAAYSGGKWRALGSGPPPGGGAVTSWVRSLTVSGNGRLHRRRLHGRRRDPAGRQHREVERLGVERGRREHQRGQRDLPAEIERPGDPGLRLTRLRWRDVRERERQSALGQPRRLRRQELAAGRLERSGQRGAQRPRYRPGRLRREALCGRQLHERGRHRPGQLPRLVSARRSAAGRWRHDDDHPGREQRAAADRDGHGHGARERHARSRPGRIPYNATVDVTGGRLVLRADTGTLAVSGAGGITAAFVLRRGADRGRPIVELRLAKGNFAVCPKRKTSAAARRGDNRPPALGRRDGPASGRADGTRPQRYGARGGSPPTAATAPRPGSHAASSR